MGFASAKNSQRVIKSILNGNDEKSIIVASACASNTSSLTTELRNIINSKLANIIPPKNIAESERLINAREFVIPLLRYNKEYTADENYFSLITLSRINSAQTLPIVVSHLHSSTEVRSILCISRILSDFTDSELQSAGILKEIQRYVYEAANTESLYLPESFLIYCEYGMSEAGKTALSNVKDLTLVQYTDTVRDSTLSLFSNVETLTIVGEFESFYALSLIGHNLKSVVMCDLSKTCDLYDILHYNLPSLEKFHFHSAKTFYIDGSGLDSIYHIKELGLFLYNNLCEVFFDKFSQFTNLHRLQIFSEFLEDLSYEPLILNVKPQELQLFLPDYTPVADQSSLSARLESIIRIARETKLTIRSFPYPFGKINE